MDEIEELRAENATLRSFIKELQTQLAAAVAEIAELKERLDQNPRNSSVPPSSEGYKKPPTRRQRRAEQREVGKQRGAPGKRLEPDPNPDEVIPLDPDTCTECDESLEDADIDDIECRQVFDLPERRFRVREYQARTRRCKCGTKTKAPFPKEAIATTCYGPQVRALAVFLTCGHHLPFERAAVVMAEICGLSISPGSIVTMVHEAAIGLESFNEFVREALRNAPVVNFDETGARIEGSLFWVHSASTERLTSYLAHKRRGGPAIEAMGIIAITDEDGKVIWTFGGIACHDGWKAYRSYDVVHALCNAHHLRELQAAVERGEDQSWASELIELLLEANTTVATAKQENEPGLGVPTYCDILSRYDALVSRGFVLSPKVDGRKQSKTTNLLKRLDEQRDDVLRFMSDFSAPFTNNLAERDIRMIKLQQKISGCWRTQKGAENFCKIRSYISTAKKHGESVMDVLIQLFRGETWMPDVIRV